MEVHDIDFIEAGCGEKVILIHSSVSGAKQWRSLMEDLAETFHVIAINMFGYGQTQAWEHDRPQTLADHAKVIEPFLPLDGCQISIVGHSFGGSVAMKAAALFKGHVRRLVLIEPNPFYLLEQYGRVEAFQEAARLRDLIQSNGRSGSWEVAAEGFANYWNGAGSWDTMPEERKMKFCQALRPNFHEWDAVMNEQTTLPEWETFLPKDTTILSAADTVRTIADIVSLLKENASGWKFEEIEQGGHMAVMTKPELINPIVVEALK